MEDEVPFFVEIVCRCIERCGWKFADSVVYALDLDQPTDGHRYVSRGNPHLPDDIFSDQFFNLLLQWSSDK